MLCWRRRVPHRLISLPPAFAATCLTTSLTKLYMPHNQVYDVCRTLVRCRILKQVNLVHNPMMSPPKYLLTHVRQTPPFAHTPHRAHSAHPCRLAPGTWVRGRVGAEPRRASSGCSCTRASGASGSSRSLSAWRRRASSSNRPTSSRSARTCCRVREAEAGACSVAHAALAKWTRMPALTFASATSTRLLRRLCRRWRGQHRAPDPRRLEEHRRLH